MPLGHPLLLPWFALMISFINENDEVQIISQKNFMRQQFHIKHLGPHEYFLGIEVARSNKGIFFANANVP